MNTSLRGIDEKVLTPGEIGSRCRAVIDLQGPAQHVQRMVYDSLTCLDLKVSRADPPRQFEGQFLYQVRHPEAWV